MHIAQYCSTANFMWGGILKAATFFTAHQGYGFYDIIYTVRPAAPQTAALWRPPGPRFEPGLVDCERARKYVGLLFAF